MRCACGHCSQAGEGHAEAARVKRWANDVPRRRALLLRVLLVVVRLRAEVRSAEGHRMKTKRRNRHEIFRAAGTATGKEPQRASGLDAVSGDTEDRNTAGLQEAGRFTPQPEGF